MPPYLAESAGIAMGDVMVCPRPWRWQRKVGFRYRRLSVATGTANDENGGGTEAGNHKGCPYNGFVEAYFRTNEVCSGAVTKR